MVRMARPFDVVVWGATGFTGRLVCEQLARNYQGKVRWAFAGRNKQKLEDIREELSKIDKRVKNVPILLGSLDDAKSLLHIAEQTKVLISTAGPYIQMGTPVVDASVKAGCHYIDLTAEIPWMLEMRQKYEKEAQQKGICIVHSCGFDSIPADITALLAVDYIKNTLKMEPGHMDLIVTKSRGGPSGGTIMSGVGAFYEQPQEVLDMASQPYCLNPPGMTSGPDPPDSWKAQWVAATREWALPSLMQFINSPNVRKSAALLKYGPKFGYREVTRVPIPYVAIPVGMVGGVFGSLLKWRPFRNFVLRWLPAQGEGPSRKEMETGCWKMESYAEALGADGEAPVVVRLETGDEHGDPGYMSTSRMLLEAALVLALQEPERLDMGLSPGGFPTPASAMGTLLLDRLRKAGFTFKVNGVDSKSVSSSSGYSRRALVVLTTALHSLFIPRKRKMAN